MRRVKLKGIKIPIHIILSILVLAYFLLFNYLDSESGKYFLIATVILFSFSRKLRFKFDLSDYFWLIYALIMVFFGVIRDNPSIAVNIFFILIMQLIMKILIQTDQQVWRGFFYQLLFLLGFIHALAVLFELINPGFIADIRKFLSVGSIRLNAGYRSGITNQPGVSGFCISLFSCICIRNVMRAEKKNSHALILLMAVIALFLTGKRTLVVVVVFSIFIVFYLYYAVILNRGLRVLSIIFISIILVYFASRMTVFSANFDRLLRGGDAGRSVLYRFLIENIQRSPIIGVGRDVFTSQMTIGAHNEYLRVLSENGLLGFLFYFFALILPLFGALRTIIINRSFLCSMLVNQNREVIFTLLISVFWQITILLYAFTGNPLNTIEQSTSYFVFTAIGIRATNEIEIAIKQERNRRTNYQMNPRNIFRKKINN